MLRQTVLLTRVESLEAGLGLAGAELNSFTGAVFGVCAEHRADNSGMVLVVLTQTQLVFLLPRWQETQLGQL